MFEKHSSMFELAGSDLGTDSSGSKMETPIYIMKPILLGDKVFPAQKVVGVNLSHVNATIDMSMDFVFGFSTLKKANWLFDFPQKKWAILKMVNV